MLPLEACKLFSSLAPDELEALKSAAREMSFPGGAVIFQEGDAGDACFAIKSGAVLISGVVGEGGERKVFSRLPEGEVFGEMAVLDNQPRSANATAEVDTVVYCIPREPVLQFLERSPQFSLSMLREITQRLRDFNRQYIRNLLQVERMSLVGRFASSIVHDLRNPLTIIGIASDLACQPNTAPEARRVAQSRIRKQVERISNMVSEILEFTRGVTGAAELSEADYPEFVIPIVEEIEKEIESKGVVVEMVQPPPAIKVAINPRRLSRVFYNLMFNAVDEMPRGGKIRLHFRTTPNELVTEVEDTGKGIAPQIVEKLFEAFATFGKSRGTGLGLSIAKRIVEEHGGRIYAQNVPCGGALFGFTLPLRNESHSPSS